jgi:uncharacterized protein YbaP (TraB family)
MKLFFGLLAMLFLDFFSLTAQQLPKTLLWRITGKDGHQPSYLYGTMHLTDERLFNLGDSLYAAIAHSEGFAMELDPDALITLLVDEIKKSVSNAKNLKDFLSAREYDTYGPRLAKKLGKPLDEITSRDILREKNRWITESYRQGKMPTFLDTYLYDIARRQDKWTGGVEDADDQRGLLDDAVDESDIRFLLSEEGDSVHGSSASHSFSHLINVYANQDLSAIDSIETNADRRDIILTKRNIKMAGRMDSLSGVRSMVFAVGAAHLPGDSGLIHLLRKRGFDVEPVFSSRKIKASDYVVKEVPRPWEKVMGEDSLYQVSMPGKAVDIQMFGIVNMKMYYDLFEGIGYFSMVVHSSYGDASTDSLMDGWAKIVFRGKVKRTYTTVNMDGGKGRLYEVTDQEGYKKALILSRNGMLFMVYSMSLQQTEKNSTKAGQFIQSFQLLKSKEAGVGVDDLALIPHIDSTQAYRVSTPFPAKPFESPGKAGWTSHTYVSSDVQKGIYYFFGDNGVTKGHYIPNDSSYLSDLKHAAMAKVEKIFSDTSWIWNGVRVTEFRGRMKEGDFELCTRYIMRGNRWYALVVMYPMGLAQTPIADRFFSSFSLMDYPANAWQVQTGQDSIFSTWSPGPVVVPGSDSGSTERGRRRTYYSFDSTRSMSYSVSTVHLGTYFWSVSDSAFWAARIKADLSFKDSLLYKRPVNNGGISGWEWTTSQRGSNIYTRRRELLYGDVVYYLFASGLPEEVGSVNVNRFFDDFRFLHSTTPATIFQSKSEQLLKALLSEDSTTAEAARSSLYSAPFTAKDLPLLHQTLLQWRSASKWPIASITRQIKHLRDSSSFDFAVRHYSAVPDTNVSLKNALLELMADYSDSSHLAIFSHLLRTDPPAGELSYTVTHSLSGSLKTLSGFSPVLLPLLDDSLIRPSMVSVFAWMSDSGWLDIKALYPYRATLQRHAHVRIRKLSDPDDTESGDDELIRLVGRFNDAASNLLLHQFFAVGSSFIRHHALEALLCNKAQPDPAGVRALAADKGYRLQTYQALRKHNLIGLFPSEYRTQKAIAEALVHDQAAEVEDDETDSLVYLTSAIQVIGHDRRKVFFFRVVAGDNSYLACAGPFGPEPPATAGWYQDDGKAFILYAKYYSPDRQAEQIKELLSRFQE